MTDDALRPTLGPAVCRWIESALVFGPGDRLGEPFELTAEQRRLIWSLYELRPDGSRVYRQALLGRAKGYGKTALTAALALAELAGPVRFDRWDEQGRPVGKMVAAPEVIVAASSYEQAGILFAAAQEMVKRGPLVDHVDVFEAELSLKAGSGRVKRVAAQAGTVDGLIPTFLALDEVHEWTSSKKRVHLVLSNGLAKRSDSWGISITTAGNPVVDSPGRDLYRRGKKIASGEIDDPAFFFDWAELAVSVDDLLDDEDLRREAARVANPHAEEFGILDQIVARWHDVPPHEWARYHANLWVTAETSWLPVGAWSACEAEVEVDEGTPVVLAFDGSYRLDSTAVVGCTLDGHVFVVGHWENPNPADERWTVPRDEVNATIARAMERYRVLELAPDPPGWHREIEEWTLAYGDVVVAYPTNVRSRMAAACSRFYTAVTQRDLSHDANPALARHLDNAVTRETASGTYITKSGPASPEKIDLAIAAVVAFDRAAWHAGEHVKPANLPTFSFV